jgi:hypothetical protein
MLWQSEDAPVQQGRYTVDKQTLMLLTLFTGFLGAHKFYLGKDNGGAIYFAIFVLGLVFTLYMPIWVGPLTIFNFNLYFNLGWLILLLPFSLSLIDFALVQMQSVPVRTSDESLGLVFVAQLIFLVLFFIPLVMRLFA